MKTKTIFYCTECGNETAKWAGRCPACGAWNSIVEQAALKASAAGKGRTKALARSKAHPIAELQTEQELRFSTGMGELDRVLGGGAVKGSLVLVGGVLAVLIALAVQVVEQAVALSLTLVLAEGAEQETVEAAIRAAVSGYLKEQALEAYQPSLSPEKGYRVSYARIGSAILDTDGVEDYEGLTVNGGTANLTVPAKYAAVLGEVSVSYAE